MPTNRHLDHNELRDVEYGQRKQRKKRYKQKMKSPSAFLFRNYRSDEKFIKFIEIVLSQFVRFVYIAQAIFCIYIVVTVTNNQLFYILCVAIGAIVLDGMFVVAHRDGKEYTRFSISSFSYAFVMIFTVWTLITVKYDIPGFDCIRHECSENNPEHKADNKAEDNAENNVDNNAENNKSQNNTKNIWFLGAINICQLMEIIISVFLITSVLARWLLPVKVKVHREEYSAMLITFIINGGDISKMVSYIDEDFILADRFFVYLILVFFTTSCLQFSFTLTTSKMKGGEFFRLFFGTEIWALCFVLLIQEVPFLIIRVLKLIRFRESLLDYSVYFFATKNLVLCIFEVYRIGVIYYYHQKHCREHEAKKRGLGSSKRRVNEDMSSKHHHYIRRGDQIYSIRVIRF